MTYEATDLSTLLNLAIIIILKRQTLKREYKAEYYKFELNKNSKGCNEDMGNSYYYC